MTSLVKKLFFDLKGNQNACKGLVFCQCVIAMINISLTLKKNMF